MCAAFLQHSCRRAEFKDCSLWFLLPPVEAVGAGKIMFCLYTLAHTATTDAAGYGITRQSVSVDASNETILLIWRHVPPCMRPCKGELPEIWQAWDLTILPGPTRPWLLCIPIPDIPAQVHRSSGASHAGRTHMM